LNDFQTLARRVADLELLVAELLRQLQALQEKQNARSRQTLSRN
jgi:hypothetical protein